MEQWTAFLQEKWLVLIIAFLVLVLVIKLVKTVLKWVIVLAVIGVVLYYGSTYKDQLTGLGESVVNGSAAAAVTESVKNQALNLIINEAKEAKYTKNPDGSYTVASKNVKLEGTPGSNEAKVTVMNQTFTLKIDETVQKFIDTAKQNQ
ncbi:hypothetical protein MJA45_06165 [Paenibacillus aurantius]|uniref:Uncharacterized protein n=1 Tax=Paenibacillus aurantius TaxID=2918900 RepID=A0AA96RGR8_9BACL|nr:hypothetical protein [Paenibacillus aurantius]WNQ12613.1 hypothetical protein MJA45_06165 [Paenibacillus aurantius]